jgi:hypothetical protein
MGRLPYPRQYDFHNYAVSQHPNCSAEHLMSGNGPGYPLVESRQLKL